MRHDATFGFKPGERGTRGFDQVLDLLADGCRRVTQYAQTKGIRTMIENHAVGSPNFGQLVDVGNFMCADEASELAVGRNAPYAFHVHIKDFHFKSGSETDPGEGWFTTRAGNRLRGAIVGHGVVKVKQCIDILKTNGYDGYCSIEFEGLEDPILALEIGLKNLKAYIGE